MRVAFVGNSYTYFNDLPTVLATLAALTPARINLHHEQVTPGGSSLADHANLSKASGVATAAMLAEEQGWDYVVLQDQSQTPGGGKDGDSGEAAGVARAKTVAALRSFYAPAIASTSATPVLYSTWGRHGGDPLNAECCGYGTFAGMTRRTTAGYAAYAAALREAVAPPLPDEALAGSPSPPSPPSAASAAPLIVPAGRAFELVYESCDEPLAAGSLFSRLYHHSAADADADADAEAGDVGDVGDVGTVGDAGGVSGRRALKEVMDEAGLGGHPSPLGTYLLACAAAGHTRDRAPAAKQGRSADLFS